MKKIYLLYSVFSLLLFFSLFLFIEQVNFFEENIPVQPKAAATDPSPVRHMVGLYVDDNEPAKYARDDFFKRSYVKRTEDYSYYAKELLANYGLDTEVIVSGALTAEKLSEIRLVILASGFKKGHTTELDRYIREGGAVLLMPRYLKSTDQAARDMLGIGVSTVSGPGNSLRDMSESPILTSGIINDSVFGIREMHTGLLYDVALSEVGRGSVKNLISQITGYFGDAAPGFIQASDQASSSHTGGSEHVQVRSIGGLYSGSMRYQGAGIVVSKLGEGTAVSLSLDLVNAVAANRDPYRNKAVKVNASDNLLISMDTEAMLRNVIELSFAEARQPMVFKWPHKKGAPLTVFDRDDIDSPYDYRLAKFRNEMRELYGIRGTTYIRVVRSSGLQDAISTADVVKWEAAGSQVALHSEFNSESLAAASDEPRSPYEEAVFEKQVAKELFGQRPYDEVPRGAKDNFDANYWDVATRAGFLSDGYGGFLPVSAFVSRLPSAELGFTLYAIPKTATIEQSYFKESLNLYLLAKDHAAVFGFLSHSAYLLKPSEKVKPYFANGTGYALADLYDRFNEDEAITLTAREIREFEDARRDFPYSYELNGDVLTIAAATDNAVVLAARGHYQNAYRYLDVGGIEHSLFKGSGEYKLAQ